MGQGQVTSRAVSISSRGKPGANQSLVGGNEGGIVPVSERAPSWNNLTIRFVTDSLELPYPVNKLQVADMLILVDKDAVNAVI